MPPRITSPATAGLLAGGLAGEALGLRPALALLAGGQLVLGLLAPRSAIGRLRLDLDGSTDDAVRACSRPADRRGRLRSA